MPGNAESREDAAASWSDAVHEIARRRDLAAEMGGEERVARQRAQGKLTIRERIDRFLDPGSFFEIGGMAGAGEYDAEGRLTGFIPAGYVLGLGTVGGREVCVGGEDFTVRGGSGGGGKGPGRWLQPAALQRRIPLVQFADGAGASARSYDDAGRMHLPDGNQWARDAELLSKVPVCSAIVGPSAGHVAGRAVLSHFSVMVRGQGQVFAAGPPVVKRAIGEDLTKEELGGVGVHVRASGVVDNEAEDEEDAFRQIRAFLGYLPPTSGRCRPASPRATPPVAARSASSPSSPATARAGTTCATSSASSSMTASSSRCAAPSGAASSPDSPASTATPSASSPTTPRSTRAR